MRRKFSHTKIVIILVVAGATIRGWALNPAPLNSMLGGKMKCKKCQSENLQIVKSGPHNKLVCSDCLAFQKFLSKSEVVTFQQIKSGED